MWFVCIGKIGREGGVTGRIKAWKLIFSLCKCISTGKCGHFVGLRFQKMMRKGCKEKTKKKALFIEQNLASNGGFGTQIA